MVHLDRRTLRALGAASGIGFSIAVCVLLGILIGRWIDQQLGTEPCALVVGIIIALVVAGALIYELTTAVKRTDGNGENHRDRNGSG
jgi:F0F1-type ATP synthase assembly protein I